MSQTAAEKAALLQIIADCKAAVRRHDDSSDSDETDVAYGTNRGNKLKRKARQVHAGSLDEPTGKKLTPELIEYNGRHRMILYRNTGKRDEPEEQRASGSGRKRKQKGNATSIEDEGPGDSDPYANIHLESLLAPAVEPKDIPNHPALSLPYKSRHLTDLCDQVLDIICAEHKHLVTIKRLLTHLLGDDPWVSGDKMESVVVPKFIQEAQAMIEEREKAKAEAAAAAATAAGTGSQLKETQSTIPDADVEMVDSIRPDESVEKQPKKDVPVKSPIPKVEHPSPPDGFTETAGEPSSAAQNKPATAIQNPPVAINGDPNAMQISNADAAPAPTALPAGVDPYEIINCTSPWFYPPARDEDARNFGLPAQEAEETRQLLLLAVQKEEEFIRGLERVRAMLLKADRQRKQVWNWCRADGAPELSDGEDYVDLEQWGLKEGDLIKGAEEEEEEDPKGKKTARTSRRN